MRVGVRLTVCMLIVLLFGCGGLRAAAETDAMDALYDAAGELEIPGEARRYLDDAGLSAAAPESVLNVSPAEMLHTLLQTLAEEAAAPLRLCGVLLSVTMLSALFGGMSDAAVQPPVRQMFDTLCTLICVGCTAKPLCECLLRTAESLQTGQVFMASFVPVFSAFLAAGGAVASGAAYQVFVLFLTECIMQLSGGILFPLLQTAAALGIADAVNPKLNLGRLVGGMRTAVTWVLGFIMAMFSGLMTVRSFVASAADSLAAKSVKLIASSAIPVIGSAVSDAYGTVQGSIQLLRTGVGAVGIMVILCLVLPPLAALIAYRAVFWLMHLFAEMAGAKQIAQLYQNSLAVLSAAFAILICFAVMLIVSSAIMMILIRN